MELRIYVVPSSFVKKVRFAYNLIRFWRTILILTLDHLFSWHFQKGLAAAMVSENTKIGSMVSQSQPKNLCFEKALKNNIHNHLKFFFII